MRGGGAGCVQAMHDYLREEICFQAHERQKLVGRVMEVLGTCMQRAARAARQQQPRQAAA